MARYKVVNDDLVYDTEIKKVLPRRGEDPTYNEWLAEGNIPDGIGLPPVIPDDQRTVNQRAVIAKIKQLVEAVNKLDPTAAIPFRLRDFLN